jgi:hypothetical protein
MVVIVSQSPRAVHESGDTYAQRRTDIYQDVIEPATTIQLA